MLSRVSKRKLDQNICKKLLLSPTELYLPWLCPALFTKKRSQRSSSTVASSSIGLNARLQSRQSTPTRQAQTRTLASATDSVSIFGPDQYVPFEGSQSSQPLGELNDQYLPFQGPQSSQPLGELKFPWLPLPEQRTSDTPLIINDSTTTKPPRFRGVDGISGELADIMSTMRACLHVGRFERAAALMRRLNSIFKPDAPGLLAAHNDYIRELAWKVVSTKSQQVLKDLQTWFEVELRGQGFIVNATTYAYLIQAALQDVSTSKSNRSVRRYLHLAESDGLYPDLMNTLNTVLNVQDFGRVTRVSVQIHRS